MTPDPSPPPITPPRWRPTPLGGFAPVFWWGLVRVVRWRKVLLVGGVAVALGVLLGLQARDHGRAARSLAVIFDRGVLTFGLPLVALLLAGEGFAYEVQARTWVYHLTRPVRRATFFLARFLSGWVPAALVATLLMGTLVVASGVPFPRSALAGLPLTAALATLALAALYYTLAAVFRHGFIAGLIYTFVVEAVVSSLPGSMQQYSVMFHVRNLHHRLTEGVLPVVGREHGRSLVPEELLRSLTPQVEPTTSVVVLLVLTAAVLAVGAVWTARRDFALKD